eukprot:SAG31_NODE_2170_length_6266_cov_7.557646_4_plen_465_part_00
MHTDRLVLQTYIKERVSLRPGTALVISCVAEEHGAHEDAVETVYVNVVESIDKPVELERAKAEKRSEAGHSHHEEAACRRTGPRVFGRGVSETRVQTMFEAAQKDTDPSMSSPTQIAAAVLKMVGLTATEQDIMDAVSYAKSATGNELDKTKFVEWVTEISVFASSISEKLWQEVFQNLLDKRNKVLKDVLNIEEELWGFRGDEVGSIIPKVSVLKGPVLLYAKREMRNIYSARFEALSKNESMHNSAQAADADDDRGGEQNPPLWLPFGPATDPAEERRRQALVEGSSAVHAAEQLLINMAKLYMAKALPDVDKATVTKWLEQNEQKGLQDSAVDLAALHVRAWYKLKKSTQNTSSKKKSAAAKKKQDDALRWLKGPDSAPRPRGITAVDVAKVALKEELAAYLSTQLLPVVSSFALQTLQKNWLKLVMILMATVAIWRGANYAVKRGTSWLWTFTVAYFVRR